MRQRAMIAMALACDPAIVIGDEPTTALDVMVQAQILELLERLRRELGLSLLLITHDLSVIAETCDRVIIMYAGRVAEEGPVGRIFTAPRHPYTQKLLGAFPNIQADRRTLETIPGSPPDLRDPPPGCRFQPRCPVAMAVCREVVPPEVLFRTASASPATSSGRQRRRRPDQCGGRRRATDPATGGPGMTELIRLEGLEVHFPIRRGIMDALTGRPPGVVRAVDGIDLALEAGEVLALVGESGSGKTTTGRVIVKLTRRPPADHLRRDRRVERLGRPALRDYRRRVQLIFQDPYETLNPKQTIHDFVAEPLVVNGLAPRPADREATVIEALEAAGLQADFAFRYPHELSGGQRQRVVIAGALVMGPELIVADEPVSMLDVSIRTELLRLMLDLRAERGLTYLFITHDLSLAWVIADRIAVMYLGKIMEIGPAEQVIRSPRNPYTQALVSVSPSPIRRCRDAGQPDDPRRRDARRRPRPVRLPVPPALPTRVRPLQGGGAAVVRRRRRPGRGVLARGTRCGRDPRRRLRRPPRSRSNDGTARSNGRPSPGCDRGPSGGFRGNGRRRADRAGRPRRLAAGARGVERQRVCGAPD